MHVNDIKYIFKNIRNTKINMYPNITTITTMRQYVRKVKDLGYNHEVYKSKNGQLAIRLLRKDGTLVGNLENPRYPENYIYKNVLTKDKMQTEMILSSCGVGTTHSKTYSDAQMNEAKNEFFEKNPEKLAVIKPIDMSQGKGVSVRVSEDNFAYYWKLTSGIMGARSKSKKKIIVQEYLEGFEARAVVISGKLISIVARVPAHVKGDGINDVRSLINKKNALRKKCGHLKNKLIVPNTVMEQFLIEDNISFAYKPKKNEYVLLTSISNTSLGGDMVDITEYVSEEIKDIALNGIAAIPGFMSGGVDIMMKNFDDKDPKVIEINSWPMLQSTIYPTYGQAKDPQKYFLDAFFSIDQFLNNPEDKYVIENENYYVGTYLKFLERKKNLNTKLVHHLL